MISPFSSMTCFTIPNRVNFNLVVVLHCIGQIGHGHHGKDPGLNDSHKYTEGQPYAGNEIGNQPGQNDNQNFTRENIAE